MKKLFCTLLALLLLFSLSACDTGRGGEEPSGSTEPAETSGETPVETLVQIADTEVPWYIEAWEPNPYTLPEVPEEMQNLALKMPQDFVQELPNYITVAVDFYQEYYRIGDPIQAKVSISNTTHYWELKLHYERTLGFFVRYDASGEQTGIMGYDFTLLPGTHELEYYSMGSYFTEDVGIVTIPKQDTVDFEWMYIADPSFFNTSDSFVFRIRIIEGNTSYGFWLEDVEIPIEIVEVDVAEAE